MVVRYPRTLRKRCGLRPRFASLRSNWGFYGGNDSSAVIKLPTGVSHYLRCRQVANHNNENKLPSWMVSTQTTMCIYFTTLPNKKDKHHKPWTQSVTAKCGVCPECRRARANEWKQRLDAEMRWGNSDLKPRFITFTFSEDYLHKYNTEEDYEKENYMVKREVELWRKKLAKTKVKQRHWMITEHGQDVRQTERIHIHGIIWAKDWDAIKSNWTAGFADLGEIRPSTIGYLVKYVHKEPEVKKDYKPIILCTPGIGACFAEIAHSSARYRWQSENTNYKYVLENGIKLELCDYYKKKIFTEDQLVERRRIMWENKKMWVGGLEYDVSTPKGIQNMLDKLEYEQQKHPKKFGKVKKNTLSLQKQNL